MLEITVSVKGETIQGDESTYKQKFLCYENVKLNIEDETIKGYIDQTLDNAKINPDKIRIRALLEVK